MDTQNIDLLALQTGFMKEDVTTQAIANAVTEQLNLVNPSLANVRTNLEDLPENLLDEIAYSQNIFWYDANASKSVKVNLIKNAEKVFQTLGTNYAITQVISDYFGDGWIEEWFQYSGQPFHFKVITTNPKVTDELAQQFIDIVELVKRKSTRLEEVVLLLTSNANAYCGIAVHTGDTITINQVG